MAAGREWEGHPGVSPFQALLCPHILKKAVLTSVPAKAFSVIRGVSWHIYFGAAAGCFSE